MSDPQIKSVSAPDESQGHPNDSDSFHHGTITRLFPSNNMGLVRTESGREVPFSFELVILIGEAKKASELKEGERVGYDLGWTSSGLRVTKIKTYPGRQTCGA
jgi:hypothetical protein